MVDAGISLCWKKEGLPGLFRANSLDPSARFRHAHNHVVGAFGFYQQSILLFRGSHCESGGRSGRPALPGLVSLFWALHEVEVREWWILSKLACFRFALFRVPSSVQHVGGCRDARCDQPCSADDIRRG